MNNDHFLKKLANFGVPDHMLKRAEIGFNNHWDPIWRLFDSRSIPEEPWSTFQIRQLLSLLNQLDSDKDTGAIRIGEREGRLSTPYLAELSGNFCHGVGRSGNLTAAQPKAAGASLMQNLTNYLVLSMVKSLGLPNIKGAITLPMGTGMSLALALKGCLNHDKIDFYQKPHVLMTQIDHKSPIKGINFVGGSILTAPGKFGGNFYADEGVYVDIDDIIGIYNQNAENISAIITSSAFFAPRVPDNLKQIAKFAQDHDLIHIINNAYGLQSNKLTKLIRSAIDAGRVDAVVQSTDKCFLTPVGGGIILSPDPSVLTSISEAYAGRASASPVLQLLVSLLSMGKSGYAKLMDAQVKARSLLDKEMANLAESHGERIIKSANPVSCAMTLKHLSADEVAKLGGYLYNLRVTGPRVINPDISSFGSCTSKDQLPFPYLVMNAAIGVNIEHISEAILRVRKAFEQLKK